MVEKYFFAQTIIVRAAPPHFDIALLANIIYSYYKHTTTVLVLDYELVVYMHVLPLVCIMHTFRSSKIGIRPPALLAGVVAILRLPLHTVRMHRLLACEGCH